VGWCRSVVVCALGLVGWGWSVGRLVGRGWCVRVWGWWVGVRRSWFVHAGMALVGWGRSVVVCALRLVGWGWSVVVCAFGFGVGGLGLVCKRLGLVGRGVCVRVLG